ncbi:3-keto-5-aminohexanoate cleavage protein [Paralimibaculum aggregatum]|uniref:3-keto-5-aminohexanoate cleavage protein n=1 Tax=Paralimibaculum aggregatum TaxID=3036245 RepID=A0ABQ6LLH8_9RHOB|nr:3-keto-5-aminohexanoate cleavage protein [Limibaculum sp. NKW23]GMG81145.1 3-keto-5-aminohexanoate cleavage protein [Limibaculum sp. NKW23]
MLQACLNGGRDPAEAATVPLTPEALARDALAARAAGAACLHIHPRDAGGAETLAAGPVGAALSAVRAAVPGMPVGVGTGDWIAPGGRARQAGMAAWAVQPDYASVNLNEPDAPEVIALLAAQGVATEAGIWDEADAARFLAEIDPAHCVRILVEMPDAAPAEALALADRVLARLAAGGNRLPVLLHGIGASTWAMIARAGELGLDTRIGFEDVTHLPDGSPAPDNAALVTAARRMLETR